MDTTCERFSLLCSEHLGPIVDGGAPFYAIGSTELNVLAAWLLPLHNGKLDSITADLSGRMSIQYVFGYNPVQPGIILGLLNSMLGIKMEI